LFLVAPSQNWLNLHAPQGAPHREKQMPTAAQVEGRLECRANRSLKRTVEAKEKSLVKTKQLLSNSEKNNLILKGKLAEYEREIAAYRAIESGRADLRARFDAQLDLNFQLQNRIIDLNKKISEGKS